MSTDDQGGKALVRVVFAGGKAIGCGCLRFLLKLDRVQVVGVFVNPADTAATRWYPSVTEIALAHALPVYAPESINAPVEVNRLRSMAPDLIVVSYYDQILSREVFALPRLGCINVHLALAEEYRGCYPTTWALINGEARTGVTIHHITYAVDAGDIIAQREVPIATSDTGRTLYDKCTEVGISLFSEVLPQLLTVPLRARAQVSTENTKYYKRSFPSHEITFRGDGQSIFNRIRALHFPPFPPPYFYIGETKMVIVEEELLKRYVDFPTPPGDRAAMDALAVTPDTDSS